MKTGVRKTTFRAENLLAHLSEATKWGALVLRVLLAVVVGYEYSQGAKLMAIFFGTIWLVLFAIAFIGRKVKSYSFADCLLHAFFLFSYFAPKLGIHMESSVLGIDKAFHLSAGMLLGLSAIILYKPHHSSKLGIAVSAVLFALAIGAGWEVFEWIFFKIAPEAMQTTYDDSMLDLVADTLGGAIVAGIWFGWNWVRARKH